MITHFSVGLQAVVFAEMDFEIRVLVVDTTRADGPSVERSLIVRPSTLIDRRLPGGVFEASEDQTLEACLRNWVHQQTQQDLGYLEQLYTFANYPTDQSSRSRVVAIAYMALVNDPKKRKSSEHWVAPYHFLPWEDWRLGRPDVIDEIAFGLERWVASASSAHSKRDRKDRVAICFGEDNAVWDGCKVLERYELLYEAGLTAESWLDIGKNPDSQQGKVFGIPMMLDHRRILASSLARLRGKIKYRPLVFELMAEEFTLMQLQQMVEAIAGVRLHTNNFRRSVEQAGLVEPTGKTDTMTGGRPAGLFRFRTYVVKERRAPGISSIGCV